MRLKNLICSLLACLILVNPVMVRATNNIGETEQKVCMDEGRTELTEPEEPLDPIEPEEPYSYRVNTTSTGLNVRSGPGTQYSIVGTLAKGSTVNCSFIQDAGNGEWIYGWGTDMYTGRVIYGYMLETYLICVGGV